MMLTVTILTRNSGRLLFKALRSVAWAAEVVLLDTGSTDRTLEIAAGFDKVRVHKAPFTDFGDLHNQMATLANHDWILSLDSDEVITPELAQELKHLQLDPERVYSIPRHNIFNGKWIRGCGWWPDRVIRLYHRKHTRFSSDKVHERVLANGMTIQTLNGGINHFSYHRIEDFLTKMQLYSNLFATQFAGQRKSSLWRAIVAKWMAFFRSYVIKRGFLDGAEGWLISSYNAQTAYYKYLKLREHNCLQNPAMTGRKSKRAKNLLLNP